VRGTVTPHHLVHLGVIAFFTTVAYAGCSRLLHRRLRV